MKFRLFLALLLFSYATRAQQQSLPLMQQVMDHFEKGEYAKLIPVAEKAMVTTKAEFGEYSILHNGMILFLAMSHWSLFHYPETEKWLQKTNEITRVINGENSLEYISSLNRLALLYRETGKFSAAESLYLQADLIAKKFTGGNDTVYATNLNNLASLYQHLGRYDNAEQLFTLVSSLLKNLVGESHPTYLSSLNNLASLFTEMGFYERARNIQIQVLEKRRQILGEKHPDFAQSLNNLAYLQVMLGQYRDAETNYVKATEIYRNTLGENHPAYASSISNLAELYTNIGDYDKAEQLYMQAMEIRKKTVGMNHTDYSSSLNDLATCYETMGLYDKAEKLFLESKERTARALGEQHPFYITTLNNLAALYFDRGSYEQAEPLYQQALELRKKTLSEQHPSYALSLNNLGTLYFAIGQFEKAALFFRKALDIRKAVYGEKHFDYANSLNDLAAVYEKQKQFDQAEKLYLQAMGIRRMVYGENHNDYATSMNNLASLYVNTGQYRRAEELVLAANAIWKKNLSDNNPIIALGLNNLAAVYRKWQVKPQQAEQLYLGSIEKRNKILGADHPLTASTENDLALLYMNLERYDEAEPLLLSSSGKTTRSLQASFPVLSEKEKSAFISENIFFNDCNNSFLFQHQKASASILKNNISLQLFFKSLSLSDTRNMLDFIRNSKDQGIQQLIADWKSVRTLLAAQYALPASKRIKDLAEKETMAENLEKELSRKSAVFREKQSALRVSINNVQVAMDTDEVAIEFVRFNFYHKKWTDSIIYAAYILNKKDPVPVFIPLCEESQLAKLFDSAGHTATSMVNNFYRGAELKSKSAASNLGKELYQLIWAPLEPYLKEKKKVSYSPAGKLFSIAFHALRVDSNKLLMDQYQLRQFTGIRQIALRQQTAEGNRPQSIGLFGDAVFTMDSAALVKKKIKTTQIESPSIVSRPDSRGNRAGTWPNLPGTGQEIIAIKSLFEKNKLSTALYRKTDASEEQLKAISGQSPAVLHIATHGFFLPEPELISKETITNSENSYTLAEDPLLRSGLILAGGNYAWSGKTPIEGVEDGIVTAYEISQLNLSNTELVVLSACETALGDVKGSEGVFGLQRAFKMAGVKKLIVSLWQVPDKETAELMTAFYGYWLGGKKIEDAFSQAQTDMRKKYPPYYWAAFVLVE